MLVLIQKISYLRTTKNINIPISCITDASFNRSVSNALIAIIENPIELHFLCYTSATITLTHELWALRLI